MCRLKTYPLKSSSAAQSKHIGALFYLAEFIAGSIQSSSFLFLSIETRMVVFDPVGIGAIAFFSLSLCL